MLKEYKNKSIFQSTSNAFRGLKLLSLEKSIQRGCVILFFSFCLCLIVPNQFTYVLLILSFVLLAVESINTAIELICDHVTPKYSNDIRDIKDIASSATFIVSTAIFLTFILFIGDYLEAPRIVRENIEIIKVFLTVHHGVSFLFLFGTTFLTVYYLQQRKRVSALIYFVTGLLWITYVPAFITYLNGLGSDSFSEVDRFDIEEAKFWFSSILSLIYPGISLGKIAIYLFYIFSAVFVLRLATGVLGIGEVNAKRLNLVVGVGFVCVSLGYVAYRTTVHILKNTGQFEQLRANFDNKPDKLVIEGENRSVVVYIGESTTNMHMGLYGYPRATTPNLSKLENEDPNLLVFHNVVSTHVHTSHSLLEALSTGVNNEGDKFLPIFKRKRVSIVDLLETNGIKTFLISNQGQSGSWNYASSIIFRLSHRQFSTKTALIGNKELLFKKPADHDYFDRRLQSVLDRENGTRRVTFLHSYAGHGSYLHFIPASFHKPVDRQYSKVDQESFVGGLRQIKKRGIENYDSAVRYVDHSLFHAISTIRDREEPVILMYFSDHGESVFSGRGHDSARFIHEMLRVPFMLYFNASARKKYPELFQKYEALAKQKNVATLAQIPATLLDLLGAGIEPVPGAGSEKARVIGEKTTFPPIVVRDVPDGITYINLNDSPLEKPEKLKSKLREIRDGPTEVYVASMHNSSSETVICYQDANTVGKIMRGQFIAGCLEVDVLVKPGATPLLKQTSEKNRGISLPVLVNLTKKIRPALWVASLDLVAGEHCEAVAEALKGKTGSTRRILVEFPENSIEHTRELKFCTDNLRKSGYYTAYSVPKTLAVKCSDSLVRGNSIESNRDCIALEDRLQAVSASGIYTDLSIPHAGLRAVQKISVARNLKWNLKDIDVEGYRKINKSDFRLVSIVAADPNDL